MLKIAFILAVAATVLEDQADRGILQRKAAAYEELYASSRNASLLWLRAELHADMEQREQAIALLQQVANLKLGFVVTPSSPLSKLTGMAEFDALAARLHRDFQQPPKAQTAIMLDHPNLVAEGVAADPVTSRIFIGDMAGRRIFVARPHGKSRLFAHTGRLRPLGMKVDPRRSLLWVAATTAFVASEPPESAILAFDVKSGALRRSWSSSELKSVNDLALTPSGDLYLTDSVGGTVFRLNPQTGAFTRVAAGSPMSYPNGIASDPSGKHLFVAQGLSIRRLDAQTGAMTPVAQPANLALLSVDGLYWHRGSLIAVQNGGSPGRILRLRLSSDGKKITEYDVLEAGHPDVELPTTATIMGNYLFFIANSQVTRLEPDGRIKGPRLKPVKILKLRLP